MKINLLKHDERYTLFSNMGKSDNKGYAHLIKNSLVFYHALKPQEILFLEGHQECNFPAFLRCIVFSEFFNQKTKDMTKPCPLPLGSGLLFVFCIKFAIKLNLMDI